jgi:FkbM family methyltransferase
MFDGLKSRLLALGPDSPTLREAFRLQAATRGIVMRLSGDQIVLTRGRRTIILNAHNPISVPFLVRHWSLFFATVRAQHLGKQIVLDFSCPGEHQYVKSGLSFYASGIAEDDCMDAYTSSYLPQAGDVVWDVGAHAGMTSYFLSRMVGPRGLVYAFEPDDSSYDCLVRNIETHGLENVIPVKSALSNRSGTDTFLMDGSMGAGLSDFLRYEAAGKTKMVQTISFADACKQFGSVPRFVKLDVEGAEISVIGGALEFLAGHSIHFSIESNHVVNGCFTAVPLEQLFRSIGYRTWSSNRFGQLFTWADPAPAGPILDNQQSTSLQTTPAR